ncbi:MAG: Rab family GTPase [Candidatus Acidiferrales bacterium]
MLQKKICMLGSFSVGKTSLVRRFVESIFDEKYQTTIGVKVDKKVVRAGGEDLTLVLWDIHGEDVFQKMRMSYLRGMSGYLLVADGTRRQTLDDALSLDQRVRDAMGAIPSIVALNKFDRADEWEIEPDRLAALEKRGRDVIRTSARTGEQVAQAFSRLAATMLESAS